MEISAKQYNVVNGTSYHIETPAAVISVLETARSLGTRIKLTLGDVNTGRSWLEEYDITGTVGRSAGAIKIPLLIHNRRSCGGPGMLDRCIIKIVESRGGRVLYQAKNYQAPDIEIVSPSDISGYCCNLFINGSTHSRHRTFRSAERLKKKLL